MFQNKFFTTFFQSLFSLILIAATLFIVLMMMRSREIPHNTQVQATLDSVEVTGVEQHSSGIDFTVDGEVIPFRRLNVVPEVAGRVLFKSNNCRMGRSVKKGELLLQVDPTDYELDVSELTEAVSQAKSNIDQNEVELENARKELSIAREQLAIREQELKRYESAKLPGVYSGAEFDTVRSTLLTCRDAVQKLENSIRVLETKSKGLDSIHRKAEVCLATAKLDLARTRILSPISGIVTSDKFEVNSYVQKGTCVAEILDTSQLEIQCSLYMRQIKWIWLSGTKTQNEESEADVSLLGGYVFPSTSVTIIYDLDGEKWSWEGKLRTLDGGGLNAETRMVPCRVTVENPQSVKPHFDKDKSPEAIPPPTLFPGMFVSVIVHAKPNVKVYRVPEKAILPGNRVWTATDGILKIHQLRIATTMQQGVLFYADKEGPQLNDWVVVSPLVAPVEGRKVHVVNPLSAQELSRRAEESISLQPQIQEPRQ